MSCLGRQFDARHIHYTFILRQIGLIQHKRSTSVDYEK